MKLKLLILSLLMVSCAPSMKICVWCGEEVNVENQSNVMMVVADGKGPIGTISFHLNCYDKWLKHE